MRWLLVVGLLYAAPAAAQTVVATAVDHEPNLIHCGDMAVAGWVTFRVDRTVSGPRIARGTMIRVVVQCPTHVQAGTAYRFTLATTRPTTGSWHMFSQNGTPPNDGLPLYWAREDALLPPA